MELPSPTPMVTFSELWRLRSGSEMRTWLEEDPRWISEESAGWRYADASSVGSYRIVASGRSTLRYERVTTGWMRIVVYAGILLAVLTLLSPSWLSALALLLLAGYAWPDSESPLLEAPAEQVGRRAHPGVAVIYFAGLVGVVRVLADILPSQYGTVLVIGVGAYGLTRLYSNNALPGQPRHYPTNVLKIPLGLVRWAAVALGLLLLAVLAAEWVVHFTEQTLASLEGNPRAVGSISSDMTGGAVGSGQQALFLVRQLTRWLPPAMCLGAAYFATQVARLTMSEARRLQRQLANTVPPTATTRKALVPLVVLYVGWSVVAFAQLILVGGIIWFGLRGEFPLLTVALDPVAAVLPPSVQQTPAGLLTAFYRQFDTALAPLPVVDPRSATLTVLALVFAPAIVLAVGFAWGLVVRPLYRLGQFIIGTPLDQWQGGLQRRAVGGLDCVTPVRVFGQPVGLLVPAAEDTERGSDIGNSGSRSFSRGLGLALSLCAVLPGWQQLRSLLFPQTFPTNWPSEPSADASETGDRETHRDFRARVHAVIRNARTRLLAAAFRPMLLYYGPPSSGVAHSD